MAITISKYPDGIYPAYNDSYLQFTSSLSGNTSAQIKLYPESSFPNNFLVFADLNSGYTFNLKEAVISRFNGFDDQNTIPTDWGATITDSYLAQNLDIIIFNEAGSGETTNQTYEFFKSVKQIDESIYSNTAQILNYSTNGIDYNLTYFEGFPFHFDLLRISGSTDVTIKNLNSSITSTALSATSTNSFQIYVDKGSSNWTTSNWLPLSDNLNRLEIYENGSFKTNLNLKKIPAKCGVYLKWFNSDGSYSYYLFDEFTKLKSKIKSLGEVARNEFLNVGNLKSPIVQMGKNTVEKLTLKATLDDNEVKILKSLYNSSSVQMYTSNDPFISGEWVNVEVTTNYEISNKNHLHKIKVTIELPQLNTITL